MCHPLILDHHSSLLLLAVHPQFSFSSRLEGRELADAKLSGLQVDGLLSGLMQIKGDWKAAHPERPQSDIRRLSRACWVRGRGRGERVPGDLPFNRACSGGDGEWREA